MKIWICIPVFNRIQFTLNCLASLKKQTYKNFTVVVCDHGSTDGTTERLKQDYPEAIVINADSSLWWTAAINRCVEFVLQHAQADDRLLTLNNDTELPQDYLAHLSCNSKKYPEAVLTSVIHDIATGKRISIGGRQSWLTAQETPVTFEADHLPGDDNVISVSHASGRGTLFPVSVFRQLGLYDEQHLPHYAADFDFSHRARRAGHPIYVCNDCRVFSYVAATGMSTVRDQFSVRSLINYFTSTKSPANLKARWWFGWNNCPKALFPLYIALDFARVTGSYFRYFLFSKP